MITVKQLATLAREVREAQKEYFSKRTTTALYKAKDLEHKLDLLIIEIEKPIDNQIKMFKDE